jgi:hypothetical protein
MFWETDNAIRNIEIQAAEYRRVGNLAQAKSLYICLVAMTRKSLGASSQERAANFYRLGECYSDEGNGSAAKTYYERAAEIWIKTHALNRVSPLWFGQALLEIQHYTDAQDASLSSILDERAS